MNALRLAPRDLVPVSVVVRPPPADPRRSSPLAAVIGAGGVAALSRAFFDDTWASVAGLPWSEPSATLSSATDGDACLERQVARAADRGCPALLVMADGPGVPRILLDRARTSLARGDADCVLGPREGGGLYLIGIRRPLPGLFAGVALDRPDACAAIRERLRAAGVTVEFLPSWLGATAPSDLGRLRRLIERGEVRAPATARRLERPRISVVVAVHDDEHRIAGTLAELGALGGLYEILVVDGGSTDRTLSIARRFPVRVLTARRGTAAQANAGARAARGDVLWFVPPDVTPPRDALTCIADALVDPGVVGGAFRTRTIPDETARPWLPTLQAGDLRARFAALPTRDQALFARDAAFRQVGGFPDLAALEDVELARRLTTVGRLVLLRARVLVSAARIGPHPLRRAAALSLAPLLCRAGVPAELLDRALRAG